MRGALAFVGCVFLVFPLRFGWCLGGYLGKKGGRTQFLQSRLRFLIYHRLSLDCANGFEGLLLEGLREGVAVVEDVGCFCDSEDGTHFCEHVVLLETGEGC